MRLNRSCSGGAFGGLAVLFAACALVSAQTPLRQQLKALPFKIAYESYVNDNWEIFVMAADGSAAINVTNTPKEHEHYPQVSPDGAQIAFAVDQGEGRDTIRSLWVMDTDGQHRRKLADHAREQFWRPDGQAVGFLPQEYPKWNVIDYYTKGMNFCELATGEVVPHANTTNLHHLYNPGFARNGKWIVSTVHAGMGVEHAILLLEAHGSRIINLKIPGCRPCLSPDGKQIAWGPGDHEIAVAPIDLTADNPAVGPRWLVLKDAKNEIYHVDWSPDSRFLSFSRGPKGEGDPTKAGTFAASAPIVGVYAPGWNIGVVSAERSGTLDLNQATDADLAMLTTNGYSNKESAWFRPRAKESRR